jgi:hypothetical protein
MSTSSAPLRAPCSSSAPVCADTCRHQRAWHVLDNNQVVAALIFAGVKSSMGLQPSTCLDRGVAVGQIGCNACDSHDIIESQLRHQLVHLRQSRRRDGWRELSPGTLSKPSANPVVPVGICLQTACSEPELSTFLLQMAPTFRSRPSGCPMPPAAPSRATFLASTCTARRLPRRAEGAREACLGTALRPAIRTRKLLVRRAPCSDLQIVSDTKCLPVALCMRCIVCMVAANDQECQEMLRW